jgi:hypothetical protein
MKEKGKKLQIALTKRTYEKPILIPLNTGATHGKRSSVVAVGVVIPPFNTSGGPS